MTANLQPIVAFLKRTYPLPSLDPVGLPSQSWEGMAECLLSRPRGGFVNA